MYSYAVPIGTTNVCRDVKNVHKLPRDARDTYAPCFRDVRKIYARVRWKHNTAYVYYTLVAIIQVVFFLFSNIRSVPRVFAVYVWFIYGYVYYVLF